MLVWNEPCIPLFPRDLQFHPPSSSCSPTRCSTSPSSRSASYRKTLVSGTRIPATHVSGVRQPLCHSQRRSHPRMTAACFAGSPSQSKCSIVYVVEVHLGE